VPENSQQAHSSLLVAGLANELKMGKFSLNLGDSQQQAAGFFNLYYNNNTTKNRVIRETCPLVPCMAGGSVPKIEVTYFFTSVPHYSLLT